MDKIPPKSILFGLIAAVVFMMVISSNAGGSDSFGSIIFWVAAIFVIVKILLPKIKANKKFMENFFGGNSSPSSPGQPEADRSDHAEKIKNIIDVNKLTSLKSMRKNIIILVVLVIAVVVLIKSVVVIPAGETGVVHLFGKVRENEVRSGIHLINPLAMVTKMTIRTEEYTMSILKNEGKKVGADAITALTKEGLNVDLDITVLYHLNEEQASDVYRDVGTNYEEKIIRPQIRSGIREVVAQYVAGDIYSEKRKEVEAGILTALQETVDPRGIAVEEVLLRNVVLPANLAQSIQEKLQADQEQQKYDFVLQKEVKEKERKVIEAEGQRDAQSIINQSLTPTYLHYLYIRELKDREGTIYVPISPTSGLPLLREVGR